MTSADIRSSFIDYFKSHDHRLVPSGPLVPAGDPTLLFANAGMVQFKNYFLGVETPDNRRAVSAQKCLRVSGKHNDIENVGPSPRHHTFFEMLGNFSFGDYFKAEAIQFGWDLVTQVWNLPPEHLFATVFEEDDEAFDLWHKVSSLPEGRILRCGAKDNFWAMGDTGPCGPCSEIFVDCHPDQPAVDWEEGSENGRYLEIWNLVFMQFERQTGGDLQPLPNPSIDTGSGLERVAAVLQGVPSNYETDLFLPLLEAGATLAGVGEPGSDPQKDVSLRVIADHLRAVTFLLADGVIPGNEGRGYVLRRILRRAVRHGMGLGLEEPFLHRLVPVLGEIMDQAYPQLVATREATVATLQAEEEKFLTTLASGARQLQEEIEGARRQGQESLDGAKVFQLYDTFGMPLEVIREIAEEERFGVDEEGFEKELAQQRERSRKATGDGQKRLMALQQALLAGQEAPTTAFDGYGHLELSGAEVQRLALLDGGEARPAAALATGEQGALVLDRTVFYAESGGEVGDVGEIRWPGGSARVTDTQKNTAGTFFHFVEVREGSLSPGLAVDLEVGGSRRRAIQRNHTATHLLHAALREVLGESVRQAGSLVAPERLRFDFTYSQPLTAEQRLEVESRVNHWVLRASSVEICERSHQEAVAAGAMALFGEKYGDTVRTVEVPGFSLELCGGCHVANTGEIGLFLISGERGIASGVRRIEAVTGEGALEQVRQRDSLLEAVGEALGGEPARAPKEITELRQRLKEKEEEVAKLRLQVVSGAGGGDGKTEIEGIPVLLREVPLAPVNELRDMADALRSKLGSGVVVIGAGQEGKVTLMAAVSKDLIPRVHAGKLVKAAAAVVGGGGGGRPDFAQAGGKDHTRLEEALEVAKATLQEQLGGE
ncbi:MAG: alanine--tRNA ligase [Deltaproteobacteria bacterium]|nr:alanine--tRNA ligase [Deltaproteobacteria bacterium]